MRFHFLSYKSANSARSACLKLYRIHEALFGAIEDDDREEHGDTKETETVEECRWINNTGSETSVFEEFKDWSERIQFNPKTILFRSET